MGLGSLQSIPRHSTLAAGGEVGTVPLTLHLLFCAMVVSFLLVLYLGHDLRQSLRKHGARIVLLGFVALLWRLPSDGQFFYGLEYEDAYVYSVSGRYFSEGAVLAETPGPRYMTTVCAVGSWRRCKIPDLFSGHFIGYPYLIAVLSRILQFSASLGAYVSYSASLLAIVPIFLISKMIEPQGVAAEASAYFYSITPVFAVYGVGMFAERLSNFLVLCSVFFFMRMVSHQGEKSAPTQAVNWLALTSTALYALVVKRENLLLIPMLAVSAVAVFKTNRGYSCQQGTRYMLMLLVSASLSFGFALGEMQLISVIQSERTEFGVPPFNWSAFIVVLPLFARSYASQGWYLGGLLFLAVGLIGLVRGRRMAVPCAILFAAYLLLYSSHVRSYYLVQAGDVGPIDVVRYSMNLAGLWSILAGLGFSYLFALVRGRWSIDRYGRRASALLLVGLCGYTGWGYVNTDSLKTEMTNNESRVRIEPARAAIRLAVESGVWRTFVVTPEPLMIHLLSTEAINVIDFRYLEVSLLRELQREFPDSVFLYLEEATYLGEIDRRRYATAFGVVESVERIKVAEGQGFWLYRLTLPPQRTP